MIPTGLAFCGLWLSMGNAQAADAWGRPEHLRAVAAPPRDWADLDRARAPVRLWWDQTPGAAEIQAQLSGAWRTLSQTASPGWTSQAVPLGTLFRVRLDDGDRWSPAIAAPPWESPADLARLAGPGEALLADLIGQVSPDFSQGGAWASTVGGGLARLQASGLTETWTRWEGLPDDRVLAVDSHDGELLVGTAAGAALLRDQQVVRIWDRSLSDPYVQAVLIDAERYWLGSYRGLACVPRIDRQRVLPVLEEWSVFSLGRGSGQAVWAGFEGLARLTPSDQGPPCEAIAVASIGALSNQHIYDTHATTTGLWVASQETGLWHIPWAGGPNRLTEILPEEGYGVTLSPQGTWIAAGHYGLHGPNGEVWGRAEGLPSHTIWSVASDPGGGLWLGTDRGAALVWPQRDPAALPEGSRPLPRSVVHFARSHWPAATPTTSLLSQGRGAFIGGPDGLRVVGQPHRHAADLVVATQAPVIDLQAQGSATWVITDRAIRMSRQGRLHQVELPAAPRAAAVWDDRLWVGGEGGLWWYKAETDRFVSLTRLQEIERLAPGRLGLWVIAHNIVYQVVAGGARPFLQTARPLDIAPDEDGVWVGTVDGLERLQLDGDVTDALEEDDAGVEIPAVAADGQGGCWFAGADGSVGRLLASGDKRMVRLPEPDPARPRRIVVDGADSAWVLTDSGTWRVHLPAP